MTASRLGARPIILASLAMAFLWASLATQSTTSAVWPASVSRTVNLTEELLQLCPSPVVPYTLGTQPHSLCAPSPGRRCRA